jgi:hypothetical protein
MSTPTVAPALISGNGDDPRPLTAQSLGWIGEAIDRLAGLRRERDRVEKAERELTAAVLDYLRGHGLPALRTERTVATVIPRTTMTVAPVPFIVAAGDLATAAPALRVLVEKARGILSGDALAAIATTETVPTLRVELVRV